MFNPNDLEFSRHVTAIRSYLRDMEKLIRERQEKDLFLSMMLAERSLGEAMERMNRMRYDRDNAR